MTQNDSAEPLDNSTEAYDPTFDGLAKIFLFIDFCFLCLVEARVIRGLWFTHGAPHDTFAMFSVPIAVLFPGLMAFAARLAVRRLSMKGEIQPTAAGRVQQLISGLALMAYVAMLQLAELAFR
jgi:hypothetical protein